MNDENKIKILFIDDDRATNFLNKYIAKSNDKIDSISLSHSGFEAIDFLKSCLHDYSKKPNLIFLDINMPAMNGWDFLEEFYELDKKLIDGIKVVILSSSDDPTDLNKFKKNGMLLDFLKKPLNKEALNSVLIKILIEV